MDDLWKGGYGKGVQPMTNSRLILIQKQSELYQRLEMAETLTERCEADDQLAQVEDALINLRDVN